MKPRNMLGWLQFRVGWGTAFIGSGIDDTAASFGNVPLVMELRDVLQVPAVAATAYWPLPAEPNTSDCLGRMVWNDIVAQNLDSVVCQVRPLLCVIAITCVWAGGQLRQWLGTWVSGWVGGRADGCPRGCRHVSSPKLLGIRCAGRRIQDRPFQRARRTH